jgi:hypothetical protein
MGSNMLRAIANIAARDQFLLTHESRVENRINRVGDSLEVFVQQAFAGVFETRTRLELTQQSQNIFSYVGNHSNPPDFILRGGDAVEVKKLGSLNAAISLNSSYPKSDLHSTSTLLNQACRNCESSPWTTKDMSYVIGSVTNNLLKQLWFVDGACYAANPDVYEQVFSRISNAIQRAEHVNFRQSNELGRAVNVDPLERTTLRVRGMWEIQHPNVAFKDLIPKHSSSSFRMLAVLRESKYQQIIAADSSLERDLNRLGIQIAFAQVLDPNNKARLLDVRLVRYEVDHG